MSVKRNAGARKSNHHAKMNGMWGCRLQPRDLSRPSGTLSEGERDLLQRPPMLLFRELAPQVLLPCGEGPAKPGESSHGFQQWPSTTLRLDKTPLNFNFVNHDRRNNQKLVE